MSSMYRADSKCLRYVVPFQYEEAFDVAMRMVENQEEEEFRRDKITKKKEPTGEYVKLWQRREETLKGPESDLYGYVKNEFRFGQEVLELPKHKAGCEWIFKGSQESKSNQRGTVKELVYFHDGIKKNDIKLLDQTKIIISNVGLRLFRNGLGLIWYEMKVPELDSKQLIAFQNTIKELNRSELPKIWEKKMKKPDLGILLINEKGKDEYLTPFMIGSWIDDMLSFLQVRYLAERKNTYEKMYETSVKFIGKLQDGIVPEKTDCKNNVPSDLRNLPDKALLFSYVLFEKNVRWEGTKREEDESKEKYGLVYHITNGYTESYHFSQEMNKDINIPFEDAYWYATQEGVSYTVWPKDDNRKTFSDVIDGKVRLDYFNLYLKVLYQSYSLLLYAERVVFDISAVKGEFLEEGLGEHISELYGEINLFLAKSMATSVSHIHHQSSFYNYLKKQLRIQEDVESVTAGLHALEALQREHRYREESKREAEAWKQEQLRDYEEQKAREIREAREKKSDNQIQAIMGLFALLGICSGLIDGVELVNVLGSGGILWDMAIGNKVVALVICAVIMAISVLTVIAAFKAVVNAFFKRE